MTKFFMWFWEHFWTNLFQGLILGLGIFVFSHMFGGGYWSYWESARCCFWSLWVWDFGRIILKELSSAGENLTHYHPF
jgi:hypothetical protein